MVASRQEAELATEPPGRHLVAQQRHVQNFECDDSAERQLTRQVNHGHAAAPNLSQNLVITDDLVRLRHVLRLGLGDWERRLLFRPLT